MKVSCIFKSRQLFITKDEKQPTDSRTKFYMFNFPLIEETR